MRLSGITLAAFFLWHLTPQSTAWCWTPIFGGGIYDAAAVSAVLLECAPVASIQSASPDQAKSPPLPQGQPPGPTVTGQNGQTPHLIELSAKNWRPLKTSEKFALFYRDLINPGVHFSLAVDAAISLGTDGRDYLGEGMAGFGRRYGYNFADEANFTFVEAFLLPTIFREDPRYIPLDKGTRGQRIAYAMSRTIFAKKDSGRIGINKSKLVGTLLSSAVSNLYTPQGRDSSAAATFTRTAIALASDSAFNLFKEFWPDFARKIRLNVWIESIVERAIRDVIRVD